MPIVQFTENLRQHVDCPQRNVPGGSVRAALDAVFAENQRLKGYVLDDLGRLRQHMVIFVGDRVIADREGLSDLVSPDSEVYVMQALSGG